MSKSSLQVLGISPTYNPSTIINVDIPLKYLSSEQHIHYVSRLENEVRTTDLLKVDVIVLCRNIDSEYHPYFQLANELGIPMLYVLDDDIMGVPEEGHAYGYYNRPNRKKQYQWFLDNSALIRVHSPTLQETIEATTNTPTSLVWAPVDWSLVPEALPDLQKPYKIVYAATVETGDQLFSYMRDDLHELLHKYPNEIELHFLGFIPQGFEQYTNVKTVPFDKDYERFFKTFTRAGYAIGLAPMIDTQFHKSKTDVKYRDYAAAGAVGIYMSSVLYNASVIDGETGLIVSGERGSWIAAIDKLILNPTLLETMRLNARQAVFEKYHMDVVGPMWMADFEKLPKRPPLSPEGRKAIKASKWDQFVWLVNLRFAISTRIPMPIKQFLKRLI